MLRNLNPIDLDQPRERILAWEGCLNARDLGGYPTADGRTTKWGAIVRSDSLAALTPAGQDALRTYGIRTIVDLRLPSEVAAEPNPFATPGDHGITYLHRSFRGDEESREPPATLAEAYVDALQRDAPTIGRAVSAIATASDGGVLIHCVGGRDRTAVLSAFLLDLVGVPRSTIGEDYALSTACLQSRDEAFLENGPGDRAERERTVKLFQTRPEVIIETLRWIDETFGSVRDYLHNAGVSDQELTQIRARLIG